MESPSVITIYDGKEVERVVVCETNEDARKLIGNLFDTNRKFEAQVGELFDPETHLLPAQQGLFAKGAK